MLVTKADGTQEAFDPRKLTRSLERAGAKPDEIATIVGQVEAVVHEGMRTQEIYRHAFALLRSTEVPVTARYALRRALFGLGPTGFPFETFLARLFKEEGYDTRTGLTMAGKCVVHEVDLAAFKHDHAFIAEAKFHARPGLKSDLQVALYSYARFLDLSEQKICAEDHCGIKHLKIITNTKFTTAAIQYAECVGIEPLGWDYPKKGNLYDLIDTHTLYPITVVRGLTVAQKQYLLGRGVVVCEDLTKRPDTLRELNLSPRKIETLLSEARQLSPTR